MMIQPTIYNLLQWFLLLCLSCSLLPDPVHAADEQITLQLKWKHQFQFAGYYAAIEQGYYHDVGLHVHLREAELGKNPVDEVLNGKAEYGTGTSDLLLARQKGAPIVVLGVIFQHSPAVLVAHPDAVRKGITDLKGKKIMLEPNSIEAISMLRNEGLPLGSYQRVHHSFSVDDWRKHKVDAMDIYITDELFELSQGKAPYQIFKPIDFGIDFYGDNFFTTEQEIHQHPQRVKNFRKATLKGWEYAMTHQDEIIDLLVHKYHARHSAEKLHYEAEAMLPLLEYGMIPTGYMYEGRWQDIVRTYQKLGLLPNDVPLGSFLYQDKTNLLDILWSWRWQITVGLLLLLLLIGLGIVISLRRMVQQRVLELHHAKRQADASNAEKTRFLASASHDLRQPMQAMMLNIESLIWSLSQADINQSECITISQSLSYSHAAMCRILDALLDISKLDAGVIELHIERINLNQLLVQMLGDFSKRAEQKGIKLQSELMDVCVYSDLMQLESILNNLISNALRYTERDGEILVRCFKNEQEVILEVRDTGIGIAKEQLASIFHEFVQLNNPERNREKGLGLGLSIVQRLVHLLPQHAIHVTSTLHKGSCFRLSMPEAEYAPSTEVKTVPLNQVSFAGMRVLILEDDDAVRKAMLILMRQWQCDTQDVASAEAALTIVQDGWIPQVMIADYRLPNHANGVQLIQQLHLLLKRDIPALIVTGEMKPEHIQHIEDSGFPMLKKPLKPVKLMLFLKHAQNQK